MKRVFISRFDKKRELDHYLNVQDNLCDYWAECKRACPRDKDCATKRFYERYPEWRELGVGAMMIRPVYSQKSHNAQNQENLTNKNNCKTSQNL